VYRVFIIWIFTRRAKKRATAAPVAGVFPRPVLRPKIKLGVAKNLKNDVGVNTIIIVLQIILLLQSWHYNNII